jgi:hypothetical protein
VAPGWLPLLMENGLRLLLLSLPENKLAVRIFEEAAQQRFCCAILLYSIDM